MASEQSHFLSASYRAQIQRFAAQPDMDLQTRRDIGEDIHRVTLEPEGVTYREDNADGVPALWCLPEECAEDRVIVYSHGGGFFMLSMYSDRKVAGHIAKAAGIPVLAFNYRLAPEHPYPAQLEDAVTVHRWLLRKGIEPGHIATLGQSAGGNLCLTSVLKLRDLGEALPAAILPISPWFDLELKGESMATNAGKDAICSRLGLDMMVPMFLGQGTRQDPLLNPLYADLTGLPPVLIHAGGDETLRDDSRRLKALAEAAGVDVTLRIAPEMQHCFPYLAGRAPEADEAVRYLGQWLRPRLGLPPR